MILIINGQKKNLQKPLSIEHLLEVEGYGDMLVAIARNGVFIARTSYEDIIVADGDEIEIVSPMQGG